MVDDRRIEERFAGQQHHCKEQGKVRLQIKCKSWIKLIFGKLWQDLEGQPASNGQVTTHPQREISFEGSILSEAPYIPRLPTTPLFYLHSICSIELTVPFPIQAVLLPNRILDRSPDVELDRRD
jgi:hypothetical protein